MKRIISRLIFAVACILLFASCDRVSGDFDATVATSSKFDPQYPPPPDLRALRGVPGICIAEPKSSDLTAAEKCWLDVLSKRCAAGDDCLTTCISSGQGALIGGGCWHVCSQPPNALEAWSEPEAGRVCSWIGNIHGYRSKFSTAASNPK